MWEACQGRLAAAEDGWISVGERLPDAPDAYIVNFVAVTDGYDSYVGECWFWPAGFWVSRPEHEWVDEEPHHRVTHWRSLPEPPKEER